MDYDISNNQGNYSTKLNIKGVGEIQKSKSGSRSQNRKLPIAANAIDTPNRISHKSHKSFKLQNSNKIIKNLHQEMLILSLLLYLKTEDLISKDASF